MPYEEANKHHQSSFTESDTCGHFEPSRVLASQEDFLSLSPSVSLQSQYSFWIPLFFSVIAKKMHLQGHKKV